MLAALGTPDDYEAFNRLAEPATPNLALLASLRDNLPGALVWTYTYKPLVGMLSATDPAGKITSYEYDSSGRLTVIRDNEGSITQSFDYHYKQ